jgi:hypothetical protein
VPKQRDVCLLFAAFAQQLVELSEVTHMNAAVQAKIAELKDKVTAETNVVQSAITLLTGLSAIIAGLKDNVEDPAAVLAAVGDIETAVDSAKQSLADAVVANTPSS